MALPPPVPKEINAMPRTFSGVFLTLVAGVLLLGHSTKAVHENSSPKADSAILFDIRLAFNGALRPSAQINESAFPVLSPDYKLMDSVVFDEIDRLVFSHIGGEL